MTFASKKSLKASHYKDPIDFSQLVDLTITKPGRYMGHELGVKQRNWEGAKVRWTLTYPELYEVGISNSGHIILYSILNEEVYQPSSTSLKCWWHLTHN